MNASRTEPTGRQTAISAIAVLTKRGYEIVHEHGDGDYANVTLEHVDGSIVIIRTPVDR